MTCIVGIAKGNTVWLGADSAATDRALNRTIIKDPKVFVKGNIAFGVCGLPKVMDALHHAIDLPVQRGDNDRAFLVAELVPSIREGLKTLDCTVETESGLAFEGAMIVGYRGKVYNLQGNFQLVNSSDGYASVGSGSSYALGSLVATKGMSDPRKRVLAALEASTRNAGCAPPFVVVTVKG